MKGKAVRAFIDIDGKNVVLWHRGSKLCLCKLGGTISLVEAVGLLRGFASAAFCDENPVISEELQVLLKQAVVV